MTAELRTTFEKNTGEDALKDVEACNTFGITRQTDRDEKKEQKESSVQGGEKRKKREREKEKRCGSDAGGRVHVALQKCRFACYIRHAVPCTAQRVVVKKKIWMCLIPDSNTHPRLPVPHKFSSSRCKDSDAPHTKTFLFRVLHG